MALPSWWTHDDRRAKVAQEYRRSTAEILGKIQVAAVVQELRAQEKERIAAALKSDAVRNPLQVVTGRYSAVRQGEDGELVLLGGTTSVRWPWPARAPGSRRC